MFGINYLVAAAAAVALLALALWLGFQAMQTLGGVLHASCPVRRSLLDTGILRDSRELSLLHSLSR